MNKRLTVILVFCLVYATAALAQYRWNQAYQDYINQYKDIAIEEMLRYNIPASITLAQGLLESGAGKSDLARNGNNHFGIKCHDWTGRTIHHDDDDLQECFRAYDSALQSYEDHSKFLRYKPRYSSLFRLERTDYKGWAHGLKAAGYATNPQYAYSLINIIETYNLSQYDKATSYSNKFAQEPNNSYGNNTVPYTGIHTIRIANKNYYVVARQGDTFRSISKEVGVSYRKLARYNERDKNMVLAQGDIVFLKKKRTKADKIFKHVPHIVKAGESMYTIAQRYGIRLKSLYKKNHLDYDHEIRPGEILKVY